MTLVEVAIDVLLSIGVLAAFVFCGYRVVLWARRGQKSAYVVGALLSPIIGVGNVSDPDFRIVNEAKQHKNREDDEPGDPPNLEDELELDAAAEVSPPRGRAKRRPKWPFIGTVRRLLGL